MSHAVTGLVAATAAVAAMLLASPDAKAGVSEACYAHLASVKTSNTTPAADRRYHLEHGQPSPCTEKDAQDGSRDSTSNESKGSHQDNPDRRSTGQSDGSNDEGKSRWCRKHWYC